MSSWQGLGRAGAGMAGAFLGSVYHLLTDEARAEHAG